VHDYHAVKAVLERLVAELDPSDLRDVELVRVRAGAVFSPEALAQAYEMLTVGTPLEGSRLLVEAPADRFECGACGHGWTPSSEDVVGGMAICPSCGTPSPLPAASGIEVVGVGSAGAGEPPVPGA
jgi:Zn finger protein HypA/HybF involved in hydrogenase expression